MRAKKIILVTVDTLRADRLECYGYGRGTSPNIDALAAEAILFEEAYSTCTYTVPAHAAMLTGRYPSNLSVFFSQVEGTLDNDRELMAQEVLAQRGYETAGFVGAAVLRKSWGLASGFRVYDDEQTRSEENRPEELYRLGEETNGRFFDWLKANVDKNFFAWLHYFDVHGPYISPGPFASFYRPDDYGKDLVPLPLVADGEPGGIPRYQALGAVKDGGGEIIEYEDDARVYLAGYDSGVRYADHVVGELIKELKSAGIYDEAAIVVAADHGESLGEGDVWFFHGLTVTPEQARVPLLLKLPGGDMGGTRRADTVSTADIMPTVLGLACISPDWHIDGRSLLSPPEPGRAVLCENEWQRGIYADGHCLIKGKQAIRDGFSYYFDSSALCAGSSFYLAGKRADASGPRAQKLSLEADRLSASCDLKEISIRRKDQELRSTRIDAEEERKRSQERKLIIEERNSTIEKKDSYIDQLQNDILRLNAEWEKVLSNIRGSYSWRITAPLRWMSGGLKGAREYFRKK